VSVNANTDYDLDDDYDPTEPMRHALVSEEYWPSLVIEFKRAPEAPGYQEMAVTPLDWFDDVPDVIVLQSSMDVGVYQTTDGRVVHVYRTTDAESGA
jgi:hypothetical protein